jgi:hypothetical protein
LFTIIPTQTARIFDIADVPFSAVNDSEQQIYAGTMQQTGSPQGYKFRQYWVCGSGVYSRAFDLRKSQHIGGGVRDEIEQYSREQDD